MSEQLVVNRIPALTWNRLRVNQRTVEVPKELVSAMVSEEQWISEKKGSAVPVGKGRWELEKKYDAIPTGCGEEVSSYAAGSGEAVRYYRAGEAADLEKPLALKVRAGGDAAAGKGAAAGRGKSAAAGMSVCRVGLETAEGTGMTVLMDAGGDLLLETKALVGAHSTLRLVQVHHGSLESQTINDIGVTVKEGGRFELVQIFLGGRMVASGCETCLQGKESTAEVRIGYQLAGDQVLDMNYVLRHVGKRTDCKISAAGSLDDRAVKCFRGTIDFIKGCSESTGAENEDVLLMSEGVRNQSLPLILCGEEDVAGAHGASIGRPDEEKLFYLSSRGIAEEAAYGMLSRAKVDSAVNGIGTVQVRCAVSQMVSEILGEGKNA